LQTLRWGHPTNRVSSAKHPGTGSQEPQRPAEPRRRHQERHELNYHDIRVQTTEGVLPLDGHEKAFEAFGGKPEEIRHDNLTSAVTKVLIGRDRMENERAEPFVPTMALVPPIAPQASRVPMRVSADPIPMALPTSLNRASHHLVGY